MKAKSPLIGTVSPCAAPAPMPSGETDPGNLAQSIINMPDNTLIPKTAVNTADALRRRLW